MDRVFVRNCCSREKIDPRYEPLIAATIAAFLSLLPDKIADIRISGSVARGDDEPGRSDIDFVALVDGPVDETRLRPALDALERTLQQAHPVALRVDFMVLATGDLAAFPRFMLSSDSVSIYGADTLTASVQSMRRDELVPLVTLEPGPLIQDYRAWVEGLREGSDDNELRRASRVIGKDLLRSVRGLALLRGGEYEQSLGRIYQQALLLVPELEGLARELHALYRDPTHDKRALLQTLNRAEQELLPVAGSLLTPRED